MKWRAIAVVAVAANAWLSGPVMAQSPPAGLLPEKATAVIRLEITRERPGHWPLCPWKRAAMKRRGESPAPIQGPVRTIIIRSQIVFPPEKKQ